MKFLLSSIIIVALALSSYGQQQRVGANLVDKLKAVFQGLHLSFPVGERIDLKEIATNRSESDEDLFDCSTQELVEMAGFMSRTHQVTTSDGYITELINIINPLADQNLLKQPPVLFFHGAMLDPSSWISGSVRQHHPEKYPRNIAKDGPITSSNRSLAFVLANHGFDVWLAGTRGCNRQNLRHTQYTTELLDDMLLDLNAVPTRLKVTKFLDTLKYLDFSQDQLVEIEFPKQMDEVAKLTGSKKVSVVAYSKGTQIMAKVLYEHSRHNLTKDHHIELYREMQVHSMVALAPILNNVGTSNFWKVLAKIVVKLPNSFGNLVFSQLIASSFTRRILTLVEPHTWLHLGTNFMFGSSPRYRTSTELSMIGHFLTGESFTEAKHYCQQILAGKLQKFDHGSLMNSFLYNGHSTPPVYDLSRIRLERLMLVSGEQDILGTPDSSRTYFESLAVKPDKWIKLPHANHIDLVSALDNDVTVNLPVLEFMERHKIVVDVENKQTWKLNKSSAELTNRIDD